MERNAALLAVWLLAPGLSDAGQFGTGFAISPKGYLVTCHHVVGDADRVIVHTGGGYLDAAIVALDPREVAYYRVDVPAGAASWGMTLTPTTANGEGMMAIRKGALPNAQAGSSTSDQSGNYSGTRRQRDGGRRVSRPLSKRGIATGACSRASGSASRVSDRIVNP